MQLYKNDVITIRCSSILKDKFQVAIGFLWMSEAISVFMQEKVRDWEKQYWIIPIRANKDEKYDLITKCFWVKINKSQFDHLESLYPKALHWMKNFDPDYWPWDDQTPIEKTALDNLNDKIRSDYIKGKI